MRVSCTILLIAINLGCMVITTIANFPAKIPNVNVTEKGCTDDSTIIEAGKQLVIDKVASELNKRYGPPCLCRGADVYWSQFYYANDSSSWEPCTGDNNGEIQCQMLSSSPIPNSHRSVCGRIKASRKSINRNQNYAFENYLFNGHNTLTTPYVTGLSITYNSEHVWTFAVPQYRSDNKYVSHQNCKCSNSSLPWPYKCPAFINQNFFCDSDDIKGTLWSGEGCSPDSDCCNQLPQPPWFCTTLPTNGDSGRLEIKHFGDVADIDSIELYSS